MLVGCCDEHWHQRNEYSAHGVGDRWTAGRMGGRADGRAASGPEESIGAHVVTRNGGQWESREHTPHAHVKG